MHLHHIPRALLKPIHLSVADVIVPIRQCRIPHLRLPPPSLRCLRLLVRYRSIERQCGRDAQLHGIALVDGVDLAVVIKRELQVIALARDACDAVVLVLHHRLDLERGVEEERVGTTIQQSAPVHEPAQHSRCPYDMMKVVV